MTDQRLNRNADPEMRRRLGRFFQAGRVKKDLTQEQLAEKLGITKKSVSFIENGKTYPNPENIFHLTQILELSLDEFVYGCARTGEGTILPELNEMLAKLNSAEQEYLIRAVLEICHMLEVGRRNENEPYYT